MGDRSALDKLYDSAFSLATESKRAEKRDSLAEARKFLAQACDLFMKVGTRKYMGSLRLTSVMCSAFLQAATEEPSPKRKDMVLSQVGSLLEHLKMLRSLCEAKGSRPNTILPGPGGTQPSIARQTTFSSGQHENKGSHPSKKLARAHTMGVRNGSTSPQPVPAAANLPAEAPRTPTSRASFDALLQLPATPLSPPTQQLGGSSDQPLQPSVPPSLPEAKADGSGQARGTNSTSTLPPEAPRTPTSRASFDALLQLPSAPGSDSRHSRPMERLDPSLIELPPDAELEQPASQDADVSQPPEHRLSSVLISWIDRCM